MINQDIEYTNFVKSDLDETKANFKTKRTTLDEVKSYKSFSNEFCDKTIPENKLSTIKAINEYISNLTKAKSGIKEEILNLKKANANLYTAIGNCKQELTNKNLEIQKLTSELKCIKDKKMCSCHVLDSNYLESFSRPSNIDSKRKEKVFEDGEKSKISDINCKRCIICGECKKCKCLIPCEGDKERSHLFKMKIKELEDLIAKLQNKIDTDCYDKINLEKYLNDLKEEKKALANKLFSVSKAENDLLNEIDDIIQDNAVLKNQVASYEALSLRDQCEKKHITEKRPRSSQHSKRSAEQDKKSASGVDKFSEDFVDKGIQHSKDVFEVSSIENIIKKYLDEYIKKTQEKPNKDYTLSPEDADMIKKIQGERDYFCREYQRLKDKIFQILKSKDSLVPSFECPFAALERISNEFYTHANKIDELQKNILHLRREKSEIISNLSKESHLENMKESLNIREHHMKEVEYLKVQDKLSNKVHSLQEQCHMYKERNEELTRENTHQKSKYNQIKRLYEELEQSIQNYKDCKKICEAELNCAMAKLKKLESEKERSEKSVFGLEKELKHLRRNIEELNFEKDSYLAKLDEKTECVRLLEEELEGKGKQIAKLNQDVHRLDGSLKTADKMKAEDEECSKLLQRQSLKMQEELQGLRKDNERYSRDNRRLEEELAAARREHFRTTSELQDTKEEVEELKLKLQSYVSEVRRIEDLLLSKEAERQMMLDHLKGLNLDSSSVINKTPDSGSIPRDTLCDLQDRLLSYESEIHEKNKQMINMEHEIDGLKIQLRQLEVLLQGKDKHLADDIS